MNRLTRRMAPVAASALAAVAAAALACRSGDHGPGQLAVALVDAPNPDVAEVWVNVTKVRAHEEGAGWFDVADDAANPVPVNLLALKDSAAALGLVTLPPGTVTQIRLVVTSTGNSVKLKDGSQYPLVVPSGIQSGIKIQGPWHVGDCAQTTVTLDFDALRSVQTHPTGAGVEWILRPVIQTKKVDVVGTTCEPPVPTCDPTKCASGACGANGACAPGGTGTACSADDQCLSGTCGIVAPATEGTCEPGGPGFPCSGPTDCASGTCGLDGTCGGTGLGAGATCADATECNSGSCTEGVCDPAQQGQACAVDTDCVTGFQCTAKVCVAIANQL